MLGRVFLALSVCTALFAQAAPDATSPEAKPENQDFSVQVNEVIVPVTVTDDQGRFVSDLDSTDFRVFDEG
ncbi:MAG: VWA domain-containing protein, partial [Bryobacteraceae bacterium]